jgi:hypothetical protein
MARRSDAASGELGSVLIVTFELAAAQYRTLNGDPIFQFTEALSVDCADQAEVDYLWAGLGAVDPTAVVAGLKIATACLGRSFRGVCPICSTALTNPAPSVRRRPSCK